MINQKVTGWSRHQHFGLRKEWLLLYLNHPQEWNDKGILGNRQIQSLKAWLKTAGLQDNHGNEILLANIFRSKGLEQTLPWELLWVNVVFNFPTAAWYVEKLGLGRWTTTEMQELLRQNVPKLAQMTVNNAIMEIAGLLERTPVGIDLKQGEVFAGRPRSVRREGYRHPSGEAVFYALCRLFVKERKERLSLTENVLWPWIVFGCEPDYVVQKIILHGEKWFALTEDSVSIKNPLKEWWECGSILTTCM